MRFIEFWNYLSGKRTGSEQKRYMGVIGACRVSGHVNLFDSEHKHQGFVTIRIGTAARSRQYGRDWIKKDTQLIEVHLSESQWATFVTAMNYGDGVPCTLSWIMGENIEQPEAPEQRTKLFKDDFLKTIQNAVDRIDGMLSESKLTKAQQNELRMIRQEIVSNAPFMEKQFSEHMEDRVERAKADVEAYMNVAVQRAGLAALLSEQMVQKDYSISIENQS